MSLSLYCFGCLSGTDSKEGLLSRRVAGLSELPTLLAAHVQQYGLALDDLKVGVDGSMRSALVMAALLIAALGSSTIATGQQHY
jgi:hypothetical protein